MKFGIYSIFDSVVGTFGHPFLAPNEASAVRDFKIKMSESQIASDLMLYKLADMDIQSGEVDPCQEFVLRGVVNE